MVDAAVLDKLESGFTKLAESDSKSLLKKYLTKEVFDQLKTKKTSFNSTLLDVIQSGLENHDSGVGIYAPDAEAYTVFAEIFDPIIDDYHGGFTKTDKHPPKDFGDVDSFGNLDPTVSFFSTFIICIIFHIKTKNRLYTINIFNIKFYNFPFFAPYRVSTSFRLACDAAAPWTDIHSIRA